MPFTIIRQDITQMKVDAIVNAANTDLLCGGGVCGAIFKTAGAAQLTQACQKLSPIQVGDAVITPGFNLKAKNIIHTAGPIYQDGHHGEKALLESAYRNSLELAHKHQCRSIALPLISSGIYGYPKAEALNIAASTIKAFLETHEMEVILVVYDRSAFAISQQILGKVQSYIDENLIHEDLDRRRSTLSYNTPPFASLNEASTIRSQKSEPLEGWIQKVDASFSETLLKLIDQKNLSDVAVYKKANLDRKLFSKIRSNPSYNPSKRTAIALAIALKLDLEETEALLEKAGYALSHSQKYDLIVEYFILNRNYDIYQINEVLFSYDLACLGS